MSTDRKSTGRYRVGGAADDLHEVREWIAGRRPAMPISALMSHGWAALPRLWAEHVEASGSTRLPSADGILAPGDDPRLVQWIHQRLLGVEPTQKRTRRTAK